MKKNTILVLGVAELNCYFSLHPMDASESNVIALTTNVLNEAIVRGWQNVRMPEWILDKATYNYEFNQKLVRKLTDLERESSIRRAVIGGTRMCAWNYYFNTTFLQQMRASIELAGYLTGHLSGFEELLILATANPADYFFDSFLQPAAMQHVLLKSGISCKLLMMDCQESVPTYIKDAYQCLPNLRSGRLQDQWSGGVGARIIMSPAAVFRRADKQKVDLILKSFREELVPAFGSMEFLAFPFPFKFWQHFKDSEFFNEQITAIQALECLSPSLRESVQQYVHWLTNATKSIYLEVLELAGFGESELFKAQISRVNDRHMWQCLNFVGLLELFRKKPVHASIVSIIDGGVNGPIQSAVMETSGELFCTPHSHIVNWPTDTECSVLTEWWTPHESVPLLGGMNKTYYLEDNWQSADARKGGVSPGRLLFLYNGVHDSVYSLASMAYIKSVVEWITDLAGKYGCDVAHRLKPFDQTPHRAYCDILGLDVSRCELTLKSSVAQNASESDLVIAIDEPSTALWEVLSQGCPVLLIADREFTSASVSDGDILCPVSFQLAKITLMQWFMDPSKFNEYRTLQLNKYKNKKISRLGAAN